MTTKNKRCSTCREDKPTTEFAKNAGRYDGLANVCRPCKLKADRDRNAARRKLPVPPDKQCQIDGCEDRRKGHGLCNRHLKRVRENGGLAARDYRRTSQTPRRPDGMTLTEAFRWVMPEEPPEDGAPWLWRGSIDEKGYGTVRHGGRNHFAHRVAYELFVGPIPDGLLIRHKDDTPLNINPNNLEPGTLLDNVCDRVERGRSYSGPFSEERLEAVARGEAHGMTPLTENDVISIRHLSKMGYSQVSIAEKFGVTQVTISNIIRRKTWAHVP